MQINFQIIRRKGIKINDNGQNFDFIGDNLSYVTYVISQAVNINNFFKRFSL